MITKPVIKSDRYFDHIDEYVCKNEFYNGDKSKLLEDFGFKNDKEFNDWVDELNNPIELEDGSGIYNNLIVHHRVEGIIEFPLSKERQKLYDRYKDSNYDDKYYDDYINSINNPSDYGVCDYENFIEQISEYYKNYLSESNPRKFFVTVELISKESQPKSGGWRWHKWGPYIGTKEPRCEYLYDEPEIDKVVIFELYEIS